MSQITITRGDDERYPFAVAVDNRLVERLTWEEMLGIVARLTVPEDRDCFAWFETHADTCIKRNKAPKAAKPKHLTAPIVEPGA